MISAVITASGQSERFGEDKLWQKIEGKPVIWWTINQFVNLEIIDEIVLVIKKENFDKFSELTREWPDKIKLIFGGKERVLSVFEGIKAAKGEWVITHDGARPLVTIELIKTLVAQIKNYKAVMTGLQVSSTVKEVSNMWVDRSFLRDKTWIAQTPQIFNRQMAIKAISTAIEDEYLVATDDSEFMTRLGFKVKMIPGEVENIKITEPIDLILAKQIIKKRREENEQNS